MRPPRYVQNVLIGATAVLVVGARLVPHSNQTEPAFDNSVSLVSQPVSSSALDSTVGTGVRAKLASALVQLASQGEPPLRWVAGADAVETAERKAKDMLAQVDAYRALSSNLAHDDASSRS